MTGETRLRKTRNFGIVAHIDAGKTTFTERILYYTGRTHRMGEVHDGTAVMDWMDQEQERGITITSAATYSKWNRYAFNIIDTPGHVDFTIEVERSLRVLDGVIIIFCAVGGVEPQSETVWHQANRYHIPKIAFINKIDRIGANFTRVLQEINNKLKTTPLILTIPWGIESKLKGIIDLLTMECITWDETNQGATFTRIPIPVEMTKKAATAHETMLEIIADIDDSIMELYLKGQKIPFNTLISAIRQACIKLKVIPVFCGSALRNKGIQPVLDAVIHYLPSPLEIPPVEGINPKGNKEQRPIGDNVPLSAICFKVQIEQSHKLVYIRIYSGEIKTGDEVFNTSRNKVEKVTRILRMHANKRERLDKIQSGEIAVIIGPKNTFTGDTLTSKKQPILLDPIQTYEPVISIAIEPKTTNDQDKLTSALTKLVEEDPTFRVHYNKDTSQTIISGMGELHLEVLVYRLEHESKIKVHVGHPQVVYRETVTTKTQVEETFDRNLSGIRQIGQVTICLGPNPRGYGNTIHIKTKEEQIPSEFNSTLKAAIEDGMTSGIIRGYPVHDIYVAIIDGSFSPGISTELGYRLACSSALKKALAKASPILLEPIMKLEIITPGEFIGEVINDLKTRKGIIEKIKSKIETKIIHALIPLITTFGYSTSLRSATQGRGTLTMQFSHFDHNIR